MTNLIKLTSFSILAIALVNNGYSSNSTYYLRLRELRDDMFRGDSTKTQDDQSSGNKIFGKQVSEEIPNAIRVYETQEVRTYTTDDEDGVAWDLDWTPVNETYLLGALRSKVGYVEPEFYVTEYKTSFPGIVIKELTCSTYGGKATIYEQDYLSCFADLRPSLESELNSKESGLYDIIEAILAQVRGSAHILRGAIFSPARLEYEKLPSHLQSKITKENYDFAKVVYKKYEEQAKARLSKIATESGIQGDHPINAFILEVLQPGATAEKRTLTIEEALTEFGQRGIETMVQ